MSDHDQTISAPTVPHDGPHDGNVTVGGHEDTSHEHHGFDFDAVNQSHNSAYPAVEWVHGSPVLILNVPQYASMNFATLQHTTSSTTSHEAAPVKPGYEIWAQDWIAKQPGYTGPNAIALSQAMTVADSKAMLPSMPQELSFFSHQTFWSTIALTLLTVCLLVFFRRKPDQYKPANRFQHIIEAMVLFVRDDIVKPNIHHHPEAWTPFFASIFLAILACNLVGLVPLFATATGNIFVTAAFGLSIMILMVVMGIKENGPVAFWIKLVPVPWSWNPLMMMLWLFLFVMEVAQVFIRPIVLAIRLFANMFAGHTVLLVFASLGFVIHASDPTAHGLTASLGAFGWVMTVALYALELLVCFLQAYVFVLLSAVFIGLCAHPEH